MDEGYFDEKNLYQQTETEIKNENSATRTCAKEAGLPLRIHGNDIFLVKARKKKLLPRKNDEFLNFIRKKDGYAPDNALDDAPIVTGLQGPTRHPSLPAYSLMSRSLFPFSKLIRHLSIMNFTLG